MANEISTNLSVSANTSGQSVSGSASGSADAGAGGFIGTEVTVATSAAALDLGPVTSDPVFIFVKNLDGTNFIQIDSTSAMTAFPQKVLPGQAIYLNPATAVIYAKADTAPCKIWVVAS